MKRNIVTTIVLLFTITFCFSQDIVTLKTGEDILAKLTEVTTTEIRYKKFDNQNGPIFTILRSDVLMIRYENGSKDIFTESQNPISTKDMANKGMQDATTNYPGKHTGAGWTAATTILFSPLIGIIPAAACASKTPSDFNLNYKDGELMKNQLYNLSYKQTAHTTKKKKVWLTFGLSSALWLVIFATNQ